MKKIVAFINMGHGERIFTHYHASKTTAQTVEPSREKSPEDNDVRQDLRQFK